MKYIERLRALEEEIKQLTFSGNDSQDIGVSDEYIDLVQQIEGKPISVFTSEDVKKYKYLQRIADLKNNEDWKSIGF